MTKRTMHRLCKTITQLNVMKKCTASATL